MEAVKKFDFHIDIENCERLYDYGRFEYIPRPAGGWDMDILAASRKEEPDYKDEITLTMLKKMDRAHMERGFLEKDIVEKGKETESLTFDSFTAFFDEKAALPKRVLPVFRPGDVVKGYLYLELTDKMAAENIKLKFKGRAHTNIRIYHKHGYYDDIGEELYVKEKDVVWRKTGSDGGDKTPLTATTVPTDDVIAPGVHKFPFTYRIPDDARQSVPHLLANKYIDDNWAYITYFFKGTINKGKTMKKGNILTHKGIWVERVYDIASNPADLEPVREEKIQSTGVISKGSITCRVEIPARAYTRIDEIPIKLEIGNESGGDIDAVKARVVLSGRYRSKPSSWHGSRGIKVKGGTATAGRVAAGEHPLLSLTVPLEFREDGVDGNLIPAGTLNNCNIIDVEYELCVTLKRKGMHRNVDISIPISVGTHNSKAESLYPTLN